MYQALYRTYRPETFDEVLGQEHIVRILRNQLAANRVSHAYLFCGTRGTGKTSVARLLAKGLNCRSNDERPCGVCDVCRSIKAGTFIDVIEIDAASNNGIENIRDLRDSINYPPAAGAKKVYIIDEVHMLSTGAFNALLKTLEEPPEYVVFILATTEVQKLPQTILSRCMRLDFKRVPEPLLISGMKDICAKINVNADENALRIVAANADGSVRDALSILDQCIAASAGVLNTEDVLEFLGASSEETFVELTELIRRSRMAEALAYLGDILADGKDVRQFARDWINHYRNLMITKFVADPQNIVNMSVESIDRIRRQSQIMDMSMIDKGILTLSNAEKDIRTSTQPRIFLELAVIQLCDNSLSGAISAKPEMAKQPPHHTDITAPDDAEDTPDLAAASSGGANDVCCSEIWAKVYEIGEKTAGSFNLVIRNGNLTSIDDNTFTIEYRNDTAKALISREREQIEKIMAQLTGVRRAMKLVEASSSNPESPPTLSDIAKNVEDILGVNVELKDD